jgi:hypothetical protein
LQPQFVDLVKLGFDPVDVVFLIDDNMFEQLSGGVVLVL